MCTRAEKIEGKDRNLLAFSPFPTAFSMTFSLRVPKIQDFLVKPTSKFVTSWKNLLGKFHTKLSEIFSGRGQIISDNG